MLEQKLVYQKNISIDEIDNLSATIIDIAKNKDIFILNGDLGYGKTTLVRSIANKMQTNTIVSSPTFTIINEYDVIFKNNESILRHVDLYRLDDITEAYTIGLLDIIYEDGITFVEWGSKFIDLFNDYYLIDIEMLDENNRAYKILK